MNNIIWQKILGTLKTKKSLAIILSVIVVGAGTKTYFVLQDNDKKNQQVSSMEESKTDELDETKQEDEKSDKAEQKSEEQKTEEQIQTEQEKEETIKTEPAEATEGHIHSYVAEVVNATCTADGYTLNTCECGDKYKTNIVKKTGHSFGGWETVKAATTLKKGTAERKCSVCNKTETKELDRLPLSHEHSYKKKVVQPTCTTEGYTSYTCDCGDSYTDNKTAKTKHSYTGKVVAPTCTAEGYTTYTCKCGDSYIGDKTAKTEHSYTSTVVAPTCAAEGYTQYVCGCGSSYIGDRKDKLAEHSYKTTATVKAQCGIMDGYVEKTCKYCNASYKTTLPARKEHAYILSNTVPATPTQDGYYEYRCYYCEATKRGNSISWAEDHTYTIELKEGKTTTVVGHFIEDGMAEEIVRLMNERRQWLASLPNNAYSDEYVPLTLAEQGTPLAEVTKIRAFEITYLYEHVRPNGKRAISSFYDYAGTICEIIATNQKSAQEVFDAWMHSSSHDDAMIDPVHTKVGVAIFARKVDEGIYVNHFVCMFTR